MPLCATPTADPAAAARPRPPPAETATAAPLPSEVPDPPFRHLIEQMQEGAVTLSPDGVLSYANRRVAELLGLPPDRVVGQDLADFMVPRDGPAWRDVVNARLRQVLNEHALPYALIQGKGEARAANALAAIERHRTLAAWR